MLTDGRIAETGAICPFLRELHDAMFNIGTAKVLEIRQFGGQEGLTARAGDDASASRKR